MVMRLFKAMLPHIDLLRAPIRGAFMMEIERMRWARHPDRYAYVPPSRATRASRSRRRCARS